MEPALITAEEQSTHLTSQPILVTGQSILQSQGACYVAEQSTTQPLDGFLVTGVTLLATKQLMTQSEDAHMTYIMIPASLHVHPSTQQYHSPQQEYFHNLSFGLPSLAPELLLMRSNSKEISDSEAVDDTEFGKSLLTLLT